MVDEYNNKKAQILYKKEISKRIISQEKRNNSKENITSGITNNTSNNTYLNSNNSSLGLKITKTKNKNNYDENQKNYSPRMPVNTQMKKKLNEIPYRKDKNQKNYKKEKLKKLEGLNDNNKIMKKNKSFNYKKPKSISTDNNIFNCEMKKKEDINKKKVNIQKGNIKYNNYINDNNNNKQITKQDNSYTKINKNKLNVISTYENQKKNNYLLIRNKTNENNNKSKESKSNMSNYDKRKKYNVPKIKVKPRTIEKKEKEEKEDLNILSEEGNEKEKNISKLIQNQEASYIKVFKKLLEEGSQSKKVKDFEMKRKFIEENGVDFENLENENEEEEKEENDENEIIKNIEKANNKYKEKKESKYNKKMTLEINENNMKKNDKINKEKIIFEEDKNLKAPTKIKMNKELKKVINKNNNNNNINLENNSNNKFLILQNDNINMNISGSSEKINNENHNINYIINKCNQYNIIRHNNYDKDNEDKDIAQLINRKEKRKQNVNTLEYCQKIINYLELKDNNKKEYFEDNKPNNDSLGESFRKSINSTKNEDANKSNKNKNIKNNNNPKKIINNNEIEAEEQDINKTEEDSEFNYNSKKNKRSRSEIQEYMEKQKKKNKKEEEKNLKNNQAKKLNKYFGLYKLQEGINLNISKNRSKIYSVANNNINNNIQNKKEVNENKNNLKGKIQNDFYVEYTLKRKNSDVSRSTESSQSTIVDQKNYYYNLFTSKNILSSNYNPNVIYNENLNLENKNLNNNKINNITTDNSNNIRITTKDKDIQNTYDINTNSSNNKISQEINEKSNIINNRENKKQLAVNRDLFVKCKETLEKANQLFSKSNIDEYLNNYKASYDDKNIYEANNYYNNENMEENNEINGDNDENNQIINTQINKSESKANKSVNEEIYQNNNQNDNDIYNHEEIIQNLNNESKVNNSEKYKNFSNNNNIENNNNDENINNIVNDNDTSNNNTVNNNLNYKIINYNEINQISELNYKTEDILQNLQKENKIEDNQNNENKQQNKDINTKNNEDIKDIIESKKAYFFSQEDLENYYKIFISLDDYLNSLTKKNALNDIISYGDLRYTYRIGFEHIIFLLKSYPFNLLRLIYQRQYYKDVLRQFFIPYLRRAFNNINIYTYNKQKFLDVNKVIEQIYRIVFLKRLIFYGQIKELSKNEENIIKESDNIKNEEKQLPTNKNIVINIDNINNNEKNNKESEKEKALMINKEKIVLFIKVIELCYKKLVFSKLYNYCMNSENIIKKNENDILDKSNISSQRYNTYIYESFSEKSSLTAYPNSEVSARLHKVCELLEMQRKPQLEDENNNLSELANDSIQSIKSLDDEKFKKRNNIEKKNNKLINNLIDIKKEEKNIKENLIKIDENKDKKKEIKENLEDNKPKISNNSIDSNEKIVKEKEMAEEDGLNIPYKEIIDNLNKNKEKLINNINNIDNINNININIENNNKKEDLNNEDNKKINENINGALKIEQTKNEENKNEKNKLDIDGNENKIKNDNINIEITYENLPRKIENEQYKKIEIINDNINNSSKYTGCVKKIEISNNLKINRNNQHTLEDISASKESNLIDWEFNNTNDDNINNKSSNRDKSPLVNDLLNSKKDDLLNSSEFNSNIKEGVIEENDININHENEKTNIEKNNKNNSNEVNNKEILDSNEKKSRNNNINEMKNEIKEININNLNSNNDNNINQINIAKDIIKTFEENNYQISLNLNNNLINNENLNSEQNNNNTNNNNLRYNENTEITNAHTIKENTNEKNVKLVNEKDEKKYQILSKLSNDNINKISNDLTEEIILNILSSEIKDKKKILFKKKKEINASLNNSSASLIVSQNSMSIGSHSPGRNYPSKNNANLVNNSDSYQTISSANNSQSEAVLNNSIFMRTLDEIKKEKTLNLYNDKVAPLLIDKIENNLEENYEKIIDNLKIPLKIDEAKMINGLMLKDRSLSISSKIRFCNENITQVKFVEEKILNDFDKIDKEIRDKDNLINDNYYDKILNKCVYDTSNEIIEKQRKYGIIGEPLFWSIRTKEIDYKYKNKDKYSKTVFVNKIIKEMKKIIDTKMGLIAENYEYLDMDQLNQDRDKKFMESITNELKDNEDYYQIFETQETYVKLSLSRIIMDQLLNEIVEILEHVQYSRKEPDKYQSKSIYACEDIPRLSFQPQTMENNYSGNLEGDGEGDESINQ